MQFKVPQNIDMEDKIIGPLTMKQFIYLIVGGMITYACIKTYNIYWILFLGVPSGLIALCLAFIKIQDQPFSKFIFSLTLFTVKPKQRIWSKDWIATHEIHGVVQKPVEEVKKEPQKHIEKSELEKLSDLLDTRGMPVIEQIQKNSGLNVEKIQIKK